MSLRRAAADCENQQFIGETGPYSELSPVEGDYLLSAPGPTERLSRENSANRRIGFAAVEALKVKFCVLAAVRQLLQQ